MDGYGYKRVNGTAAGTTTVIDRHATLRGILIGQTKTGTLTFYDSASGTNANYLAEVINTLPTGGPATWVEVNASLKNGLVAVLGGTTDVLVMYE